MPERYFKAMEKVSDPLPQAHDGSAEFCDILNARQLLNERVMTGVRLLDGLNLEHWLEGDFASDILAAKAEALDRGWVLDDDERIIATPEGRLHADSLASLFF